MSVFTLVFKTFTSGEAFFLPSMYYSLFVLDKTEVAQSQGISASKICQYPLAYFSPIYNSHIMQMLYGGYV